MVTILLQKIIELLTGFFNDFIEWANTVGDKIASIKDNTDSLPDIKDNTDSIKNNTSSIAASNSLIQGYSLLISNRATNIDNNVTAIKNNVGSIATSSGTTAAFAEDIANNTLDMDNRLVTIGSDTTQIRADSGNLAADVAEIKNTLGLYLYNTIVTEEAEGSIANFDTDLKDYLQEAKVTIPADAGGISNLDIINQSVLDSDSAEIFKGLLNGTYKYVDLGTLTYSKHTTGSLYYFTASISGNIKRINSPTLLVNMLCSEPYNIVTQSVWNSNLPCITKLYGTTNSILISNHDFDNVDAVDLPALLSGVYLIYELGAAETPITENEFDQLCAIYGSENNKYPITFTSITDGAEIDLLSGIIKINTSPVTYDSITPIAIRTYKGVNNIYSDIGTISVTYRETLKHYLKKQEA